MLLPIGNQFAPASSGGGGGGGLTERTSSNTGLAGVGLTTGDLTSYGGSTSIPAGTYDAYSFPAATYNVYGAVTITRSKLVGSGYWVINSRSGGTLTLEDCEIDATGSGEGTYAVHTWGGTLTVTRCWVHGADNGIGVGSNTTVSDCFVNGLTKPGTSHPDGVEFNGGGSSILIQGNTIDATAVSATSALQTNNENGAISDLTIDSNILRGGGYALYFDASKTTSLWTGVVVTDNQIEDYTYGPIYTNQVGRITFDTWSGNVDNAGDPIAQPS